MKKSYFLLLITPSVYLYASDRNDADINRKVYSYMVKSEFLDNQQQALSQQQQLLENQRIEKYTEDLEKKEQERARAIAEQQQLHQEKLNVLHQASQEDINKQKQELLYYQKVREEHLHLSEKFHNEQKNNFKEKIQQQNNGVLQQPFGYEYESKEDDTRSVNRALYNDNPMVDTFEMHNSQQMDIMINNLIAKHEEEKTQLINKYERERAELISKKQEMEYIIVSLQEKIEEQGDCIEKQKKMLKPSVDKPPSLDEEPGNDETPGGPDQEEIIAKLKEEILKLKDTLRKNEERFSRYKNEFSMKGNTPQATVSSILNDWRRQMNMIVEQIEEKEIRHEEEKAKMDRDYNRQIQNLIKRFCENEQRNQKEKEEMNQNYNAYLKKINKEKEYFIQYQLKRMNESEKKNAKDRKKLEETYRNEKLKILSENISKFQVRKSIEKIQESYDEKIRNLEKAHKKRQRDHLQEIKKLEREHEIALQKHVVGYQEKLNRQERIYKNQKEQLMAKCKIGYDNYKRFAEKMKSDYKMQAKCMKREYDFQIESANNRIKELEKKNEELENSSNNCLIQ